MYLSLTGLLLSALWAPLFSICSRTNTPRAGAPGTMDNDGILGTWTVFLPTDVLAMAVLSALLSDCYNFAFPLIFLITLFLFALELRKQNKKILNKQI